MPRRRLFNSLLKKSIKICGACLECHPALQNYVSYEGSGLTSDHSVVSWCPHRTSGVKTGWHFLLGQKLLEQISGLENMFCFKGGGCSLFYPQHLAISSNHVRACMLSRFSHVQLFVTIWTIAHQAPLSMGFSKQEYCSGLPCPPPGESSYLGIKPVSLMFPALGEGWSLNVCGCSD